MFYLPEGLRAERSRVEPSRGGVAPEAAQLGRELRLAAKVFENALEGIFITDADGVIIQVNPAFSRITGYQAEQAVGRKPSFLRSGFHDNLFQAIRPQLAAGGHWQGELLNRRRDDSVFPAWVGISGVRGDQGELIGFITTFRDITETRNHEDHIRRLAYYDVLTDLPNRSLFMDRLSQEMLRAQRANTWVALLFLDLDRFKTINDSLGHSVGDNLLEQVAWRLAGCVRAQDTVARMGGDEFTVILGDLPDEEHARDASVSVARKVMAVLSEPFQLQGREVFISTSVGIALCPRDGGEVELLLRHADTAMYQAKAAGKNTWQFYHQAMSERSAQRLDLQNAMHRAVLAMEEQFHLCYQPLVCLADGSVVGVECLLRWGHPERGSIAPDEFVPVAEDSGLIIPLGRWVLEQACQQFALWLEQGLALERLAVNLSARQFADDGLVDTVAGVLRRTGLEPGQLELELTESILMDDVAYALETLHALKAMGVRIAVDDFGTGYSSLNYLKQFPLDCLKIDRCFVAELADNAGDRDIARAIVALAASFNLEVVAEGVECEAQRVLLDQIGCGYAQGYLFGAPLPADALAQALQAVGSPA